MHHLNRFSRVAQAIVGAAAVTMLVVACSDSSTLTRPAVSGPRLTTDINPGPSTLCKVGPAGTTFTFSIWTEGVGTLLNYDSQGPGPNGNGLTTIVSVPANTCKQFYTRGAALESVEITEINLPAGTVFDHLTWQTDANALAGFPAGPLNTLTTNFVHIEPFTKAITVIFYNTSTGGSGCTLGFWKNSVGSWPPTGYSTGMDFDATFGVNAFSPNITLLQALNLGGGGINNLARQGTAALLSASHPDLDYPLSPAQVIQAVKDAIANGTINTTASQLDTYNNYGCTLPNDNSWLK